jgi:hypothetical protein
MVKIGLIKNKNSKIYSWIFFIVLKNLNNTLKPSVYLVRIFLNLIHLRKFNAHFTQYGTRFFYKLMLLFNSKVHKYEEVFSQMYKIREK